MPDTKTSQIKWFRTEPARVEYREQFGVSLDAQKIGLLRIFGLVAMVSWINFAFNIDRKLHPEFPELLYFRMGLMAAGALVFFLSFSESIRKKHPAGQVYLLLVFSFLSCSFFTGRIADDAGYVSGLQILIMLVVAIPLRMRTILIFYGLSVSLFIAAILMYQPDLST